MEDLNRTIRNVSVITTIITILLLQQVAPILATTLPTQLGIPTNLGWNVASRSNIPNETPLDITCNGLGYVNENSVAMNWTIVEGSNIKYQREVTYPNSSIGYFYNTPQYTPFSTFGGSPGIEGLWKTRVRAYEDNNSNDLLDTEEIKSEWSNYCSLVFDRTEPSAPVITDPVLDWISSAPILNKWTIVSDLSGIKEYQIEYVYDDGHSFSNMPYRYTSNNYRDHTPSINEQGGVSFRVRAIDNALNFGIWSEWEHYFYDATPPAKPNGLKRQNATRTIDIPCNAIVNLQTLIPDWDDNAVDYSFSHYEYTSFNVGGSIGINEQKLITSEFVHSWIPTIEGTYGYAVRAVDLAGNRSDWAILSKTLEGSCKVTYDSTPPLVNITNPTKTILSGIVPIIGSVIDANPHHYWLIIQKAGGSTVAGPGTVNDSNSFVNKLFFNWDTTKVSDGQYVIKLEARDAANNKSNIDSVEWLTVTVDNTNPLVDLVFPTPGISSTSFQAVFNELVIVEEAQDPQNYYLNNWPTAGGSGNLLGKANIVYDSNSMSATITFTQPGWYISPEQEWGIQNVHDLAGNMILPSPYSETSTPMVDPVTVDTGTDDFLHNSDVQVDLFCSDIGGSGCWKTYYNINGGSFTEGNTILLTTDGEFTINYYSIDRAGNIETEKTADYIVKIDKTPPVLTITGATSDNTPMLGDLTSGYELQTNNDPSTNYLLQFQSDTYASELLANKYFGLKLITSSIPTANLIAYYNARGIPEPYLTYLINAVNGTNPFVYINGDTIKLADAAKHDIIGGADIDMTIPGDYPLGTYTVAGQIKDIAGNETTITLILKVLGDRVAPLITPPVDITMEATGPTGAIVNYAPATALDAVDGDLPTICLPSSGGTFDLGTTTVTCSATDLSGNQGTGTFDITIIDTTGPVIEQMNDIQAGNAATLSGTSVNYISPIASDLVSGSIPTNCLPASASLFPIGTTPVTCSATDGAGNTSQMKFNIIVGTYLTPAVLGTTTGRVNTRTNTRSVVLAVGNEIEEVTTTPSPTLIPTPKLKGEVLGLELQQCEDLIKTSGIIFIDNNSDQIKQDNEDPASGVKVIIYLENILQDNGNYLDMDIKSLITDVQGKWSTQLCPGEYKIRVDETTLPEGTKIGDNDLSLTINEDDQVNFDLPLVKINSNINWGIILLIIGGAMFLLIIVRRIK